MCKLRDVIPAFDLHDHHPTFCIPSSSHTQNPLSYVPLAQRANSGTTFPPSTGSFFPLKPLKAVLQCPGLTAWKAMLGLAFPISSVSMFNAALLTEYGKLAVGGLFPEDTRSKEPRADETLSTLASEDWSRSGRKWCVRSRMLVTLVSRTLAHSFRHEDGSH